MAERPDPTDVLSTHGQTVGRWTLFRPHALPWRVRGPVHLLRLVSAAVLVVLAVLKVDVPVACAPSGWEGVNGLMMVYEFGGGLMLVAGTWPLRRFAAFAGMCVMGAVVLFTAAIGVGLLDWSLRGCHCFGGMDAPWWVHALVAATIGSLLAWTWLAIESHLRPASDGETRN